MSAESLVVARLESAEMRARRIDLCRCLRLCNIGEYE
jgi:hypothetical protein